jgi:hypothetical protein
MLTIYGQTTHFLSMSNLDALICSHFKILPKRESKLSLWIKVKTKELVHIPIHLTFVQKTKSNIDWSCQYQEFYFRIDILKIIWLLWSCWCEEFSIGVKILKIIWFFYARDVFACLHVFVWGLTFQKLILSPKFISTMKRSRRHAYYAWESCSSTYLVACAYGYYWLQNCINTRRKTHIFNWSLQLKSP